MLGKRIGHRGAMNGGHSGGFTLLEALIALIVLSIGLLGLAGLQATSLRNNQDAYFRSQATILAQSMMDELRSDRGGSLAGRHDFTLGGSPASGTAADEWLERVRATLPAASGGVDVSLAQRTATVTVEWQSERDQEDGLQQLIWESRL